MVELIFTHIPKTAGISFLHTLNELYGQENVQQILEPLPWPDCGGLIDPESMFFRDHARFRSVLKRNIADTGARVLFGHMPAWVLEDLFPGVPRITWIRDPLEQVLSRVFHFRKMRLWNAHEWDDVWKLATQPVFRNCQFFYTGGWLSQFAFVGTVEHYDRDLERFCDTFGLPQAIPRHFHKTEFEQGVRNSLRTNPDFCKEILSLNALDCALYGGRNALGTT